MYTITLMVFSSIIFGAIAFTPVALSQTIIKVVDQDNNPLPNAVIELVESASNTEKLTTDKVHVMDQINKSFVPDILVVPKNSLVSFPNSDDIRHHVYSFSKAKTFELKLYAGKPKNPVRFEQSGVVVMGCNIHDSMVGYIYVTEKAFSYITDEKGIVLVPETLTPNTQLQIWHPNSKKGVTEHTSFTVDQSMLERKAVVLSIPISSPAPRDSFETLVFDEL